MTSVTPNDDEVQDGLNGALQNVIEVLEVEVENANAIIRWARTVMEQRGKGLGYRALLESERPPVGVLLTSSAVALREAATGLRRAEARTLYEEGMTMYLIAEAFGVSRQRVAALLRPSAEGDGT